MKIRFLSGPNAGKIDHAPVSQETDLLIKAGLVEVINDSAEPLPPTFGVIFGVQNAGATLCATCPPCKRTEYYVGRPDKESIEKNFLPYLCAHFKGAEVPEPVREKYRGAWRYQILAAPGQYSTQPPSGNTEKHVAEVDGCLVPVATPKDWDWHKKH